MTTTEAENVILMMNNTAIPEEDRYKGVINAKLKKQVEMEAWRNGKKVFPRTNQKIYASATRAVIVHTRGRIDDLDGDLDVLSFYPIFSSFRR